MNTWTQRTKYVETEGLVKFYINDFMNYYVLNIDNILRKEVMEQWSKCTALNGSYQLLVTVTCTKTDGQNNLRLSRWGMVCKYHGVGESHWKFYDEINYPCPYSR